MTPVEAIGRSVPCVRVGLVQGRETRGDGAGELFVFFFFQAEDGIRDLIVTGVQTCALPILRGLRPEGTGGPGNPGSPSGGRLTIAMMPKSKGNSYFVACRKGAEEAAQELGDRKSVV